MYLYTEHNLLHKSGKSKRQKQMSKLVGISFWNYKWAKKDALIKNFLNEWRGDTEFHVYKFALRVTDLDQTSDREIWFPAQISYRVISWNYHNSIERHVKNLNPCFASALKIAEHTHIQFNLGLYFAPLNIPNRNTIINLIQISITVRHSSYLSLFFFFFCKHHQKEKLLMNMLSKVAVPYWSSLFTWKQKTGT